MQFDSRGDVLRRFKSIFGVAARILQPGNIEVVAARGNFFAGEAAETPRLALVLSFCTAQWIIAEGANKTLEIRGLQRIGLAIGGGVGGPVGNHTPLRVTF